MKKLIKILLLSLMVIIDSAFNGCSEDANNLIMPPGATGGSTVNGKVVSKSGSELSGIRVVIGNSETTTDASGRFTISNVSAPYDVSLIQGSDVAQYKGLNSLTPTISDLYRNVFSFGAQISVTIPAFVSESQRAMVFFTDGSHCETSREIIYPNRTITLYPAWNGNSQISGKVIILMYNGDRLEVVSYIAFGSKEISLNSGANQMLGFSSADLTASTAATTISGTITAPAGLNIISSSLRLKFNNNNSAMERDCMAVSYFDGSTFNYLIPTSLPITPSFVVDARASNSSGQYCINTILLNSGSSGININLEAPVTLNSPGENAMGINYNSEFTYTSGMGSGVYEFYAESGLNSFTIYSTTTSVRIPDLSRYGVGLGSGTIYDWAVVERNNFSNIDSFVSSPLSQNLGYHSYSESMLRTFTTAP